MDDFIVLILSTMVFILYQFEYICREKKQCRNKVGYGWTMMTFSALKKMKA